MEMDMEMDIPLPEELEWLEANSHLHDDYEDLEPPELYPGEEEEEFQQHKQPPKPTLSIPPKPTPITDPSASAKTLINGRKRFRSEGPELLDSDGAAQSEDKRNRIDDPRTENDDDDWLRYSPPRPPPQNEATEVVEPVVVVEKEEEEEKIVSRYASEIDGDCIPVTGPDGDRVFARMSRVEEEEDKLKKLLFKSHSSGMCDYLLSIWFLENVGNQSN